MIVGGDYKNKDESKRTAIFIPRDAPITTSILAKRFISPKTPPHGYRSAVAYVYQHAAWITVGPNGTDISTDDGKNWTPLKPGPLDQPDADRNWNALSLPFVVGPNGRIGKLRDDALKP